MSILEIGQNRHWANATPADLAHLTRRWGWVMASGIAFIFLGLAASAVAGLTTIVGMIVFGWMMFFAGVVQIVESLIHRERGRMVLELVSGILYLVGGIMLIRSPGLTAAVLTLMLAPLFLILGIARTFSAVIMRDAQWGWQAMSGVVTFWLGLLILNQWPASSFWIIGTFIGIELLFEGLALSSFALALREKGRQPARA